MGGDLLYSQQFAKISYKFIVISSGRDLLKSLPERILLKKFNLEEFFHFHINMFSIKYYHKNQIK